MKRDSTIDRYGRLSIIMHLALYGLMIVTPLLAWLMLSAYPLAAMPTITRT